MWYSRTCSIYKAWKQWKVFFCNLCDWPNSYSNVKSAVLIWSRLYMFCKLVWYKSVKVNQYLYHYDSISPTTEDLKTLFSVYWMSPWKMRLEVLERLQGSLTKQRSNNMVDAKRLRRVTMTYLILDGRVCLRSLWTSHRLGRVPAGPWSSGTNCVLDKLLTPKWCLA